MVIKTKLALVLAISLSFAACNKTTPPPSASNGGENQTSSNNEVQQKLYNLSAEECDKVIRSFKDYTKVNTMYGKIESSTIPADSSIWLIEAALNYDFDKPGTEESVHDSCGYEIDLTESYMVNSNQLASAYNYIYNYINQSINSQKQVKVIDITGFSNGNKLVFSAYIKYNSSSNGNKIMGPCDLYTSGSAAWNPCGSPNAITWAEVKLNCTAYNPGCPGSWYWTSITNAFIDNQNGAYSSSLYYVASTMNTCPSLYYTTINGYITGCRNLGTSNHPGGSYILIDYDITWGLIWLGGSSYKQWWDLNIRYGIPQCSGGGGGRFSTIN